MKKIVTKIILTSILINFIVYQVSFGRVNDVRHIDNDKYESVQNNTQKNDSIAFEKANINYNFDENDEYGNLNTEKLDPLKKLNILSFYFNGVLDFLFLKHIAKAYKLIVNDDLKACVGNVLDTYKTPISSFNSALQGKFDDAAIHFWRFAINFTFGGFGFNDTATKLGLPKVKHKTFGSTLAHYGIGPGAYLVLPIFGFTTIRDMFDVLFLNQKTNFINYEIPNSAQLGLTITNVIHQRYLLIQQTETITHSILDIYTFARDLFLIKRESEMEYPDRYIQKQQKLKNK